MHPLFCIHTPFCILVCTVCSSRSEHLCIHPALCTSTFWRSLGGATALSADGSTRTGRPRTNCPYHPAFLSHFAPADVLAVLEVAEHSLLFFAGLLHQLEVTKDSTLNEGEAIHSAIKTSSVNFVWDDGLHEITKPSTGRPTIPITASLRKPGVERWRHLGRSS